MDINMIDISNPQTVEIQVRDDKRVIWVNVDGQCVCRICGVKHLLIESGNFRQEVMPLSETLTYKPS